ncbi:MAG TPA: hypothetical protein VJZ71_00750 [Phycisphaerae bacterium]|nr:hypothetical protein [Phycisphaerae bacterium]
MLLVIQPDLVERVVFEAVRGDAAQSRAYHREFARCHNEPEGEARDAVFRQFHERWFEQLGFHRRINDIVNEFRFITREVSRVVITPAGGRGGQSAELFGKPGTYSVVLTVAAATLLDDAAFAYWARHELLHIDDMLDPGFEYDVAARPSGSSLAARNLGRDRYALLWALSIDARLAQSNPTARLLKTQRQREFALAWGICDSQAADEVFDHFWTKFAAGRPTHQELLAWTRATWTGVAENDGASPHRRAILPGDPCPACKFKTFDWASASQLEQIDNVVRENLPGWRPEDGLCGRCAEVYSIETAGCVPVAV